MPRTKPTARRRDITTKQRQQRRQRQPQSQNTQQAHDIFKNQYYSDIQYAKIPRYKYNQLRCITWNMDGQLKQSSKGLEQVQAELYLLKTDILMGQE